MSIPEFDYKNEIDFSVGEARYISEEPACVTEHKANYHRGMGSYKDNIAGLDIYVRCYPALRSFKIAFVADGMDASLPYMTMDELGQFVEFIKNAATESEGRPDL